MCVWHMVRGGAVCKPHTRVRLWRVRRRGPPVPGGQSEWWWRVGLGWVNSACSPMWKLMGLMLGCHWALIQHLGLKAQVGLPW